MTRSPFGITGDLLATLFVLIIFGVGAMVFVFARELLTPDGLFYSALLLIWPVANVLALLGVGDEIVRKQVRDFNLLVALMVLIVGALLLSLEQPEALESGMAYWQVLVFGSILIVAIVTAMRLYRRPDRKHQ